MTPSRVLVVDDTKLITRMIRDKLVSNGYMVEEAYEGNEALAKVKSFNPDLIILDVMLPGMDGYQIARRIRQDPANGRVPIVMLTAKAGIAEKIAGFEAGADDYLTKPFDPTELELRVRVLIARAKAQRSVAEDAPTIGKIISVFSLRGGSGTSSIAVNLAVALAQLYESEVPLVDLALESGSVSLMLDLIPRTTLSNLAKEDLAALDEALLKEYSQRHSSGVRLFAAPASPVLAELVTPKLIQTTLPLLRRSYMHTVVDTAHQLNELNLAAFDVSDQIIIVLTPDMLSMKSTTTILETFRSLAYPPERLFIILNWAFSKRGLPQKEIEAALGLPISLVIPHDSDATVRAINEGVPVVTAQPNTAWAYEIERLAYQVSAPDVRARADAQPSRRYALLKRRLTAGTG
ncbi:MAG: hypothetical protein A2Z03_07440 [Chloroflexi bacterium RBG_16_56_8]|nr:MAG: hypothetical protein A2Z03_07440 [Chloroflexi bacterium RBG_16_56_8]HJX11810.1 response regulator [Candidatus Binatia bacterium]